jgi:hypothetical protein
VDGIDEGRLGKPRIEREREREGEGEGGRRKEGRTIAHHSTGGGGLCSTEIRPFGEVGQVERVGVLLRSPCRRERKDGSNTASAVRPFRNGRVRGQKQEDGRFR